MTTKTASPTAPKNGGARKNETRMPTRTPKEAPEQKPALSKEKARALELAVGAYRVEFTDWTADDKRSYSTRFTVQAGTTPAKVVIDNRSTTSVDEDD